ncbi:MAG: M16 family metallopeptidase, partial [Desertimonas sp.]
LDNGLTYYVRHNDRPGGSAELRLVIDAGSVDELGAHGGVAHFVEHMMFNGTERYPENELIAVLRGFGARFGPDINAYTSYDETVYSLAVSAEPDVLDTGLGVLEQWLSAATLDPAQVEAERGVVLDEWRSRTQTADGRLLAAASELYLAGTAYQGRSPIGDRSSIEELSVEELRAFYDTWYRPDNAAVVVVGDIDVDAVVARIESLFGPLVARTEQRREPALERVPIVTDPAALVLAEPDLATVEVEVTLPLPAIEGSGTAAWRARLLDQVVYDIMLTRLDDDITAGDAPFDRIGPGTNSFVASLDAPALYALTGVDTAGATVEALLDEYERVSRFGVGDDEVARAVRAVQAGYDAAAEQAATRPDAAYADALVAHVLTGAAYPDPATTHETASALLAGLDAAAVTERFRARWDHSAPHVIVWTPTSVVAEVPTEDEVLVMIDELGTRALAPRPDAIGVDPDTPLMTPPAPVAAVADEPLSPDGFGAFDPFVLTFPNGVRVVATPSSITGGAVGFYGSSPGGSSMLDDAAAVDAHYAAEVVFGGGVGDLDQRDLDDRLTGTNVAIQAAIYPYVDELGGGGSTNDLETLFQLIHLYMTAPRFDDGALDRVRTGDGPVVANPQHSPNLAGVDAMVDARYDADPRYTVLLSPDEFATVDLAGIEQVWRERFGNAGDWVFGFAGDFDPDELRALAARYLATLPGTAGAEPTHDLGLEAPMGITDVTLGAGTGETAAVRLLFSTPAYAADVSAQTLADLSRQVVQARLTDVVREALGESYSPSVSITVALDPTPVVTTVIAVTGAPDRIGAVGDLVVDELDDLVLNGPTGDEFQRAAAEVERQYALVTNADLLAHTVGPLAHPELPLASHAQRYVALGGRDATDVQSFLAAYVTTSQFVRATVVPA